MYSQLWTIFSPSNEARKLVGGGGVVAGGVVCSSPMEQPLLCSSDHAPYPQPLLRSMGLPHGRTRAACWGAALTFSHLQNWCQELVSPAGILAALQGIAEGSSAAISGWISSCVDVMAACSNSVAWNFPATDMLPMLLEGVESATYAVPGCDGLNPALWGCISPVCS